ncbi:hypothetical protein [Aureimonas leprariae]|uniref:hypothetical protein n=1 Tax=Plantimonas leprariae TaxID=2615207 RepID=UPI001387308C|nr:hypothetical protein [Aureimonas leprariae]
MRDVFALHVFETEEKLPSFGRVVTIAVQFRDSFFLPSDKTLTFGDVPMRHFEVLFDHCSIHAMQLARVGSRGRELRIDERFGYALKVSPR